MKIKKFKIFLESKKLNYSIKKVNNISIKWFIDGKRCGVFDFMPKDDVAYIIGYMKDVKSIDGYKFIKMSIDYLLSNGFNSIISIGNRSEDAAKVWNKLSTEKEYNVETIDKNFDGYIPDRHSTKILTKK